jgi:hypothetical protein
LEEGERMSLQFDGSDYNHKRDSPRLSTQFERIKSLMLDGRWRTLQEIEDQLHYPQASISAQLRHMRKPRFGGYIVQKQHLGAGVFSYRVAGRSV